MAACVLEKGGWLCEKDKLKDPEAASFKNNVNTVR